MANLLERRQIAQSGAFRNRVRARVMKLAYDTLSVAPTDVNDAKEMARRGFLTRVIQQQGGTGLTDQVAELIAANETDANLDPDSPATVPTDARFDVTVPIAVDVLGNIESV